jgi:hypothetical protein
MMADMAVNARVQAAGFIAPVKAFPRDDCETGNSTSTKAPLARQILVPDLTNSSSHANPEHASEQVAYVYSCRLRLLEIIGLTRRIDQPAVVKHNIADEIRAGFRG